ncbi:hypothetical protein M9Y10_000645 [Tritrichomonas musculus]|uniref:Protein kinase domain-containing protein n=1 Tax=Tritrichomonas musculus TaxID=1915356 RepID=A0ABR2L4S4_9EUKA
MIQDFNINLENIQVVNKIGEGSYGIVYLVQEIETNRKFVAKETKIECQSPQDQKKFFNEVLAFSKVNNPAVLSFLGYSLKNFDGEQYPIIFTEYIPNGSLEDLLQGNPDFSSSKKYIILLGIAKGMECLHNSGIIHRDLKPANILLDQNFYPHICDFGESEVSELAISSILMDSCKGSPAYMAPEVFSDDLYSYKADMFSFAILAYQLLTGKAPFTNYKSVFRLQMDIKDGKRPDMSVIKDENIKIFLNNCWSSVPNERPKFGEIVEEIQKERYIKAMAVDEDELSQYLKYYDDKTRNSSDMKSPVVPIIKKTNTNPKNYKINAEKGDPEAMFIYAVRLDHGGNGISINKKEAAHYYKMSADKGFHRAMHNYSLLLIHEAGKEGFENKEEEAVRYCKMAIDKGFSSAMNSYAYWLSNGLHGIAVDKQAAAQYYKMAADKGNVKAINAYAVMLYNGHGVQKDKEESIRYFQMAADKGNATAMFNLGCKLLIREGPGNKEAAARYIKMAAEKGMPKAMEKYACLLEKGIGVSVNKEEAAKYHKMASEAKK